MWNYKAFVSAVYLLNGCKVQSCIAEIILVIAIEIPGGGGQLTGTKYRLFSAANFLHPPTVTADTVMKVAKYKVVS